MHAETILNKIQKNKLREFGFKKKYEFWFLKDKNLWIDFSKSPGYNSLGRWTPLYQVMWIISDIIDDKTDRNWETKEFETIYSMFNFVLKTLIGVKENE